MANYSGISDLDYYKIWIISDNVISEVYIKFKKLNKQFYLNLNNFGSSKT